MKSEQTSNTFAMEGRDAERALATSFMPSFFWMTFNGRRPRRALRAFKAWSECIFYLFTPVTSRPRSTREPATTKKSRTFQCDLRYGCTGPSLLWRRPLPMILMVASIVKRILMTSSAWRTTTIRWALGSFNGLSTTSVRLLRTINTWTIFSNISLGCRFKLLSAAGRLALVRIWVIAS